MSLEGREEEEETLETLPGAMAQAAAGQANAHSAGSLQTSLLKYLQWYLTNDQQAYHLSGLEGKTHFEHSTHLNPVEPETMEKVGRQSPAVLPS